MKLRSKLPPKLRQFATVGALIKLPLLLPAMLVVGVFILLRPFVIIQVYKVHDWRIGHMVSTTQRFTYEVREWNIAHRRKKICLYFFGSKNSANDFFKKMLIRQHLSLQHNFGFLIFYLSSKIEFLIPETLVQTLDTLGLLSKHQTEIQFTKTEIDEGNKFLQSFNIALNGKYVCLSVRDDAFLSQKRGRKKFEKHVRRNSDISTYTRAAEYLADMGYVVFRMGSIVQKALISENPRIIDYATNGMRSEFLDIFLGAHCTFCISTGSGWDEIPRIFNRPLMYVNCLPVIELNSITQHILLYPKQQVSINTLRRLSLNEMCSQDLHSQSNTNLFIENGIEIVDLTSSELVTAVSEMAARVEGRFNPTEQQKSMQEKLRRELRTNPKIQPSPDHYPIRAEFASCFLENYPNFLE